MKKLFLVLAILSVSLKIDCQGRKIKIKNNAKIALSFVFTQQNNAGSYYHYQTLPVGESEINLRENDNYFLFTDVNKINRDTDNCLYSFPVAPFLPVNQNEFVINISECKPSDIEKCWCRLIF